MVLEKVGIVASKSAKYLRACGKRSILETQAPVKVDPTKLGVYLSDNSIHFQSEDAAISYIKSRLLDSLKGKKQFERGIVKKGSVIFSETNGDARNTFARLPDSEYLKLRDGNFGSREFEFWHSHPDLYGVGKTAPLSGPECGDIGAFYRLNLKKVVAMNSKGEINIIEATKDISLEKYKEFCNNFEDFYMSRVLPKKQLKIYNKLKNEFKKNGNNVSGALQYEIEHFNKFCEQYFSKIETQEKSAQIAHEYFKTAGEYGMKYKNTFSNLKNST